MKIKSFGLKKGTWFRSDMAEYHVDKCLGRGWEGEVYSVSEGYSGGMRALKIFDSSELEEELFSNYAYKLEQLTQANVPGVVRFYHAGYYEEIDSWFLITSVANGVDLKAYEKQLNLFQALKVFQNILKTLSMAHKAGICFGDIHSENILVDTDLSTSIIDIAMEIEYSIENITEDITAVCQIFFDLCKDQVPPEVQRIVSVDNAEEYSAYEILDELKKLY